MKVLSLFDGISCGQVALQKAGLPVTTYFASEIEDRAIRVTQSHFPQTVQLGDVCSIDASILPRIDLLIGGSPCQDLSGVKVGGKGLDGEKSKLFFEFLRLKKQLNPTFFLLENVESKWNDQISSLLGVEGVSINSELFVQQSRPRVYWTNIPIPALPKRPDWQGEFGRLSRRHGGWQAKQGGVCHCLLANMGTGGHNVPFRVVNGERLKLTPEDCEELQGLPLGYTSVIGKPRKRYFHLGNGWQVDTIVHILSGIHNAALPQNFA